MDKITKSFETLDLDLKEGSREVVMTISTAAVDREGDVMIPKGMKRKNYAGNPIVLWSHDHKSLPIGKTLWIKADGPDRLVAKAYITDKTQLGRDVWGLLQDGIVGAASIGAEILEATAPTTKELRDRPEWTNARRIVRAWELLEWSLVTVPCNQEAMTRAVAKGYSPETIKFLNRGKLPEARDLVARDDVWSWPAVEPVVEKALVEKLPVVAAVVDKFASAPMPKRSRPFASVVERKVARLEERLDDDVLRKYLGRIH